MIFRGLDVVPVIVNYLFIFKSLGTMPVWYMGEASSLKVNIIRHISLLGMCIHIERMLENCYTALLNINCHLIAHLHSIKCCISIEVA